MFKFGFDSDKDAIGKESNVVPCSPTLADPGNSAPSEPAKRTYRAWVVSLPELADDDDGLPDVCDFVEFAGGAVQLRKSALVHQPPDLASKTSDLEPGSYEGGCKLWECAGDLIAYMHRNLKDRLSSASVLELGAGHALPAIYAARAGASRVSVADFNETVLKSVTTTNIRLNLDAGRWTQFRLIAGDWGGIRHVVNEDTFDFVFASEVAYALESLERLADCILELLRPDGIALIAGKSYYFGVGGGMRVFEITLQQRAAVLKFDVTTSVVEEFRDGKSNVREILQVVKRR
jgi:SAM-dependent methyltransferase